MEEVYTKWSYPLCIVLVIIFILLSLYLLWRWNDNNHWDLPMSQLWNTNFLSPWFLAIFRVGAFIYSLLIGVIFLVQHGVVQMRFYTIWNFSMLTLYFGIGTGMSIKGLLFFRSHRHFQSNVPIGKLGHVFIVLHEVCCSMSLLVDVVVWTILLPMTLDQPDILLNFWSYNQHAVNFFLMAVEFFFCQLPFYPSHCLFTLIWAGYYIIFSWIYYTIEAEWAYPFLEPRVWSAPLWYFGLAAGHIGLFFVWFGFYKLRARYCPPSKKLCELTSAPMVENDPLGDRETTRDEIGSSNYY